MLSKSSAYWSAQQASVVDWRYGLDILASDEATALEDSTVFDQNASDRLMPKSAKVELDTSAASHRQFSLMLRSSDRRYLPGPLGYASGGDGSPLASGLVWYNTRYRPWVDLRTGFTSSGSKIWNRTYLGIFVLVQPEVQVVSAGTTTTLTLIDKAALLQAPFRLTASNLPTFSKSSHTVSGYAKNSSIDTAMRDLATRAGVPSSKLLFEPTSSTFPADWTIIEGDEPWTHLQNMAGSLGHVLYFDQFGNLVRREHPLYLNSAPSAFTFTPGPYCTVSKVDRKIDLQQTYNHVVALGASSKVALIRGEAQVTNLASRYHKNQIGERVCYVGKDGKLGEMTPDPAIQTLAAAQKRAQVVLAQHVGRQEEVGIDCRNIPPLEPYDRVTVAVADAGLNLDFLVDKCEWQLAHDGMHIDVSRWVAAATL